MNSKNTTEAIRWHEVDGLILDCDGVLTDGSIQVDDNGITSRSFDMRDGLGLVLLRKAGVYTAIVSSASHRSVIHRANSLEITDVCIGIAEKAAEVERLSEEWKVPLARLAYVGDDLVDIPVMRMVGFPIALSDAMSRVLDEAAFIANKGGGKGGVREICDLIISSKESKL